MYSKRNGVVSDVVLMEGAMRSWGIELGKNVDHDTFWETRIDYIKLTQEGNLELVPPNDPMKLSTDPIEAMEEVFLQELRGVYQNSEDGLTVVLDTFERIVPFGPPFCFDPRTKMFKIKPNFEGTGKSKDDFDPFLRFEYEQCPASENFKISNRE